MYTIHQLNNIYDLSEDKLAELNEVSSNIYIAFGKPLSLSDYVALYRFVFESKRHLIQQFYVSNNKGHIISCIAVIKRKGVHPNSCSLIISSVFTHPDYRRMGFVGILLAWIIKYYETESIETSEGYLVGETIANGQSQKYIDTVITKEMREKKRIHWVLNSAVGEYYDRFGFSPCRNMTWFFNTAEVVAIVGDFTGFQLKDDSETFLTEADLKEYYFSDEYAFKASTDETMQNLAQEDSQIESMLARFNQFLKIHAGEIPDNAIFKNCGFKISEKGEQTLVFITPFFVTEKLVVQRIFTDVTDKAVFKKHWQRISEFIFSYAQNYWKHIPLLLENSKKEIFMADTDFNCVSDVISNSEWIHLVISTSGWIDKGADVMLPMIRSWKEERKDLVIANNGFMGFM